MAKKDWISIHHRESKEYFTNTEQISWESSSSEDESYGFNKTKRKKLSEVNCRISPVITFQKNGLLGTQKDRAVSSTKPIDSPVVGIRRLELYKLSPELSQRSTSIFVKEPSPVIEKRRVRVKVKKHKSKENYSDSCRSPDLFEFEPTQNIANSSPIFSECSSQATVKIEPFPSQLSSEVEPTDIQIKDIALYYQPPKRKKNYKKGGLAHQMDKALKLKKSRIKIWHHEKVNNIEGEFENQEDIIRFNLKKVWSEYGVTLLLCEVINKSVTCSNQNQKDKDNLLNTKDSNETFLVNIGSRSVLNIEWRKDHIYELFPPYETDIVKYCGQDITYYSNASKFMTC